MGALGKVLDDPNRPRGPDVEFRVEVPTGWLNERAEVEIRLPRNLPCAACGGGGCDTCRRSGAVTLRDRESEPEVLRVALPPLNDQGSATCLRIPERGGESIDPTRPRGNLLLTICAGEATSAGVERVPSPTARLSVEEQRQLMKRSLLMAAGLCALFVILLHLSGWL